jgi:hypothetical protein
VGCGEGEGVAFDEGELLALGDGETLGLAAGDGDFLEVAAAMLIGAEQASAAMQAITIWNLFFIGWGWVLGTRF